jgi:hypothetical protein
MATDEDRGGQARHWRAKVRLVIEAGDADMVRAINGEVLQQMNLVAKGEPQLTDFFVDGPTPCWYVLTELDLRGLGSIMPDDAPARFRFVTRELPAVQFMGHGNSHCGLWEWLSDSAELAGHPVFPHPGVRAAGIYISDGTTSDMWPASR